MEMKMNHQLATEILDAIQTFPQNFDMSTWCDIHEDDAKEYLRLYKGDKYIGPDPRKVDCGTTMCIAGWADMIVNGSVQEGDVDVRAADMLGISMQLANSIFFSSNEEGIAAMEAMSKPEATEEDVRLAMHEAVAHYEAVVTLE